VNVIAGVICLFLVSDHSLVFKHADGKVAVKESIEALPK